MTLLISNVQKHLVVFFFILTKKIKYKNESAHLSFAVMALPDQHHTQQSMLDTSSFLASSHELHREHYVIHIGLLTIREAVWDMARLSSLLSQCPSPCRAASEQSIGGTQR